jgi:DNA-binding CsgD family transcriptional regulator/tetratricopeptide (TPR) repeat protein
MLGRMVMFGEVAAAKPAGLLERTDELDALGALVAGAADGGSGIGVVLGPPGAGKTSLLNAARADAQGRGVRVLSARGSPHEREYPFAVVRQLLGPVVLRAGVDERAQMFSGAARHAQRLFEPTSDDLGAAASGGDPAYGTLHGLFWLLAGIAQLEPLLVMIDDAHWCDTASGGFLAFLTRRLEGLAVTLLLAERSGDGAAEEWLTEVGDDPRARLITPRPLSPKAVGAIAAVRLTGDIDDALAQACWRATGGNPFYVSAALDELAREDVAGQARLRRLEGLGPETVLRSVLVRLARLPAGAVALAHSVAVLGDGAAPAGAAALAELPLGEAENAADRLTGLGIFAAGGLGLSFAHPIVRNALYRDLTAGARGQLHARAAEMLMGAGASAAPVAVQLLRSPQGQEGALGVLVSAAGSALAQGAPQVAARYLRRALEEPLEEERRAALLLDLGRAEVRAGDVNAIEHLAGGLRGTHDPERRVDAALALAHSLAASERAAESVALLSELGDDLGAGHPELAGRVFSELVSLGDLVARPLVPARARRLATSHDPAGLTHRAVELTASARSAAEAARLAQQALAGGELLARGDAVFAFACSMLIYAEAFSPAQHFLDQALAGAVASSFAPGFVGASGQRALLNTRRGMLVEAEADARAALEVARLHDWQLWQTHTLTMMVEALLARGQAAQAAAELERALGRREPAAGTQGALLLEARGRLRLELGDTQAAVNDLLEAGRRLEAWGLHNPSVSAWRSNAATGLAALGLTARAVQLVEDELTLARSWGSPRALGVALRAQALAYNDERTIPLLRDACSTLAGSQAPVEHAHALTELGAALRRTNQRAEAREHLRAALDTAHATGALSLAQQAHTELTAAGARPRTPLRTGVDALTPSERRIAKMAAGGQSNMTIAQKLFVTIKTVEMHLTSTYRKLDISSRAQLAQAISVE